MHVRVVSDRSRPWSALPVSLTSERARAGQGVAPGGAGLGRRAMPEFVCVRGLLPRARAGMRTARARARHTVQDRRRMRSERLRRRVPRLPHRRTQPRDPRGRSLRAGLSGASRCLQRRRRDERRRPRHDRHPLRAAGPGPWAVRVLRLWTFERMATSSRQTICTRPVHPSPPFRGIAGGWAPAPSATATSMCAMP
jgi:hypothetical protein